jgi:tRNA-uridine 2-sulfurtransferase
MSKIFVAMSGGIDSAVTAALLKKAGKDLVGLYGHFWQEKELDQKAEQDRHNAQKIAGILGIPFHSLDLSQAFREQVVNYYLKEYQRGHTPNPCVVCNREIKFGLLREKIKRLSGQKLATGHYVIKRNNRLYRGRDRAKDQSYFLWGLSQDQIADLLFPLGKYQKREVIDLAKRFNLPAVDREESRGACFFSRGGHQRFIKKYLPSSLTRPGIVVDKDGKEIGVHRGFPLYTIGQRYGFKIDPKRLGWEGKDLPPFYVLALKPTQNQLVVGREPDLYSDQFIANQLNWIGARPAGKLEVRVQIRYLQSPVKAKIKLEGEGVEIRTEEKIRSVAPGQSAVFYQGRRLLGGAVIVQ